MFFPIELIHQALDLSNKDLVYFRRLAKLRLKRLDFLIKEFKKYKHVISKPGRSDGKSVFAPKINTSDPQRAESVTIAPSPNLLVKEAHSPAATGLDREAPRMAKSSTELGIKTAGFGKPSTLEVDKH